MFADYAAIMSWCWNDLFVMVLMVLICLWGKVMLLGLLTMLKGCCLADYANVLSWCWNDLLVKVLIVLICLWGEVMLLGLLVMPKGCCLAYYADVLIWCWSDLFVKVLIWCYFLHSFLAFSDFFIYFTPIYFFITFPLISVILLVLKKPAADRKLFLAIVSRFY